MRVHHLVGGRTTLAGGLVGRSLARLSASHPLPHHVLLVETDDGLVLVDTGVRGAVVDQLAALGFSTDDVRHVVLTSLAHDHAGGLADFPNADVHLLAAEHAAATARTPGARLRYMPAQWRHRPRWRLHVPSGARWFGFECVRGAPLPEGIVIVPLPGPSRGHAGVAVHGDHGWLLHAGDAYLWRDEVHAVRPPFRVALTLARQLLDADPAGRSSTRERLRVLARDPDATIRVFASHDAVELETFAERNPPPRRQRHPTRRARPALRLVASR